MEDTINSGATETFVGPSVRVDGEFSSEGDVTIDGILKGSLKTSKTLVIGSGADIEPFAGMAPGGHGVGTRRHSLGLERLQRLRQPRLTGRSIRRVAIAGSIGIAAAIALFVGLSLGGQQEPTFSLEDLGSHHIARASAEPGFAVFPPAIEVSSP